MTRAILLKDLINRDNYLKSLNIKKPLPDILVKGISADSRRIKPGFIFVAIRGATKKSLDGHDFIDKAVAAGATIVIGDNKTKLKNKDNVLTIFLEDAKRSLCHLAESFHNFPSKKLKIIGITGTNGKTSTSFMLYNILKRHNINARILGTLGIGTPKNLRPSSHTTIEPDILSQTLANFVEQGVSHVIMEVSSHALSLHRVSAINFYVTALTNISQDHLDFHKSMDAYIMAKKKLFNEYSKTATIILPRNNPFKNLRANSKPYFFGDKTTDDFFYEGLSLNQSSSSFSFINNDERIFINLPFPGIFNIKNACLAASIAKILGVPNHSICEGLKSCPQLPGRMEKIKNNLGIDIYIDFAHTFDALFNLLTSLKLKDNHKLFIVFGAGGNRDREKRPKMGAIAKAYADIVIITDDNPRMEDPNQIREEILSGIKDKKGVFNIPNRSGAIKKALSLANKGDMIIIAGKGHETMQIYGHKKIYYSDPDAVRKALNEL